MMRARRRAAVFYACFAVLFCCFLFATRLGVSEYRQLRLDMARLRMLEQTNDYPYYEDVELNRDENSTVYISVDFKGGLGNHMFQYASLLGICRELSAFGVDIRPAVPDYLDLVDYFRLTATTADATRLRWFAYGPTERAAGTHDEELYAALLRAAGAGGVRGGGGDRLLVGFLQSWRYFGDVGHRVRNEFLLRDDVDDDAHRQLADVRATFARDGGDLTYVGVHVRRLGLERDAVGRLPADAAFLRAAMTYYRGRHERVAFVVRSDDAAWCAASLRWPGFDVFLPDPARPGDHTPIRDLATLSKCNHSIVTVGTFGWWAGWLAGGDVIYQREFVRNGSGIAAQYVVEDYIPPAWIPM